METTPDFYFIAIGGIGQSALARILLKQGYKVWGSDVSSSKYIDELLKLGAKVFIGHDENNLQGEPIVVLSSAIKEDNPEYIKAKKLNLKIFHRSDLLKLISDKYPCFIGFSGTHGKTTTSGLASYLLSKANLKPAYAVGGIIPEIKSNGDVEDKNTPYFVAELDESDGTIVKYSPKIAVINNLEADHLDFYKNGLSDVFKTFSKFVNGLDKNASVILNLDCKNNIEFMKLNENFKFITFSTNKKADFEARNIKLEVLHSTFDIYHNDKLLGSVKLSIPGLHNVSNALAVCAALVVAGVDFNLFSKYFESFSGMGRRFQRCAEFGDIIVIDDYAHHPSEIKATLDAVKNYDKGRVVAIFQPHRYTRFAGLFEDFKNTLTLADYVVITDVYAAGDNPISSPNVDDFASDLSKMGTPCVHYKGAIADIAEDILKDLKAGDLVFTFGAGDITKLGKALDEKYRA